MRDTNWDLISGDEANEIEVLNLANQANVIEAIVRFDMHHRDRGTKGHDSRPNVSILRELHRTATFLLLSTAGIFRTRPVHVWNKRTNEVAYTPPEAEGLDKLIDDFFLRLGKRWDEEHYVRVGAFVLWAINWIHPFTNGNGRTARALSYACISLKIGYVLPGSPTLPDLILQNQPEYYAALRSADLGFENLGEPDLLPLVGMIQRLLTQQLASVPVDQGNSD